MKSRKDLHGRTAPIAALVFLSAGAAAQQQEQILLLEETGPRYTLGVRAQF